LSIFRAQFMRGVTPLYGSQFRTSAGARTIVAAKPGAEPGLLGAPYRCQSQPTRTPTESRDASCTGRTERRRKAGLSDEPSPAPLRVNVLNALSKQFCYWAPSDPATISRADHTCGIVVCK
jgi:hypothetical protein